MPECPPGTHSMFDFCPGDCNEPITAREMLEEHGIPEDVIDGILCIHAHELAEEIRTEADTWEAWPEKTVAMHVAANFIDPEVEK